MSSRPTPHAGGSQGRVAFSTPNDADKAAAIDTLVPVSFGLGPVEQALDDIPSFLDSQSRRKLERARQGVSTAQRVIQDEHKKRLKAKSQTRRGMPKDQTRRQNPGGLGTPDFGLAMYVVSSP
eukprot:CAMPEP_0169468490 /NCGR_PEP_ID=MMETSP1042-20121227/22937_1 /TAXON_ID=464988 /ORGANISM="Hemiselmis andersenii, Strain CCMP1180" /LENGTH=122 /DNA_ID=CAMNT_0009581829 /DNA_START=1 /DNA_END=366 /DNA_ORIENTATION=+